MKLKRTIKNIDNSYRASLLKIFKSNIVIVREILFDAYDELSLWVTDENSKADPVLFKDLFEQSIDNFEFVRQRKSGITFSVPNIETFNFRNQGLLQQIMEGTPGDYVEMSSTDLNTLNIVPNVLPINPMDSADSQVFLIAYTNIIEQQEVSLLHKRLVHFPFSNTPPMEDQVFGKARNYVKNNIKKWNKQALTTSTRDISQKYRRI